MSITIHVIRVDGYDSVGDKLFSVNAFDEACAEITLSQPCHNAESWRETSEAIARAIDMLKLETPQEPRND